MSMSGEAYSISDASCGSLPSSLGRTIEKVSHGLMVVWVLLLIPWVAFASLSGIAFDAKSTLVAGLIVMSIWSYAPAVLAAYALQERHRKAVLLPLISIAATVTLNLLTSYPPAWR